MNQAGRDVLPLVDAKNLVLELTYSIAHRIQVLIKKLCHRAAKSLNRLDESLDPGTICCGLWIVFSATHKFEKQNFKAKSLKSLVGTNYCHMRPSILTTFIQLETLSKQSPRKIQGRVSVS